MDLFDDQAETSTETQAPLAERMRLRTLDAFVGQSHLLGPERLLRRAITADQLTSLILTGPPGTGKPTLARITAHHTRSHFLQLDAVPAGVKDMRAAIETAQEHQRYHGVKTLLDGDAHFDTISAFIRCLRGSDPDAALYWLARMVYAGEDPQCIWRRMLILASEDIGLVDPQAITVVNSCAQAFDRIGLPEGQYTLAQAALYLATAPKSNSISGYFQALNVVKREPTPPVPPPLQDSHRDRDPLGHGQGYLYPHAYAGHWVAQSYLPDRLRGQVFYNPSDQGYEAGLQEEVAWRRAQLQHLSDPSPSLD